MAYGVCSFSLLHNCSPLSCDDNRPPRCLPHSNLQLAGCAAFPHAIEYAPTHTLRRVVFRCVALQGSTFDFTWQPGGRFLMTSESPLPLSAAPCCCLHAECYQPVVSQWLIATLCDPPPLPACVLSCQLMASSWIQSLVPIYVVSATLGMPCHATLRCTMLC